MFVASGDRGFLQFMDEKVEVEAKCPMCNQKMVISSIDTSHDFKNQKKYWRRVYWCEKDDVWMNIEIPVLNKQSTTA